MSFFINTHEKLLKILYIYIIIQEQNNQFSHMKALLKFFAYFLFFIKIILLRFSKQVKSDTAAEIQIAFLKRKFEIITCITVPVEKSCNFLAGDKYIFYIQICSGKIIAFSFNLLFFFNFQIPSRMMNQIHISLSKLIA